MVEPESTIFLIMYDKLLTPEEKRLLESNRQLPNETGDEYKAIMARKYWTTKETSDSHKLFNLETKLMNLEEYKKSLPKNGYLIYNPQSSSIDQLTVKVEEMTKTIEKLKEEIININNKLSKLSK